MLRYIVIGLLLTACTAGDGPIIAKDYVDTGEILLTTAKGGTYIVEPKSVMVAVGEEASYSNGKLCIGGKYYTARRDR